MADTEQSIQRLPRFYLPPDLFSENQVQLRKPDIHYLRKVLRLNPGDKFAALDGRDKAWICSLSEEMNGYFEADYPAVTSRAPRLRVGLALCKNSRFEDAIEMLSELGVAQIIPLATERSEKKAPSESKLKRWKKIAESASILAYRMSPLTILPIHKLENFPFEDDESSFFCHPVEEGTRQKLSSSSSKISLLIGPEGGFSTREVNWMAQRAGILSLGPLNLRVATAAVVASSLALNTPAKGM